MAPIFDSFDPQLFLSKVKESQELPLPKSKVLKRLLHHFYILNKETAKKNQIQLQNLLMIVYILYNYHNDANFKVQTPVIYHFLKGQLTWIKEPC